MNKNYKLSIKFYPQERNTTKMNLPNKLTLFRIILVPIMVIVSFFDIPGSFLGISTTMWIMELIFIIASITDKLDGYLARKNNQVTNFGKFLDPIADKILVVAAMILFVGMGRLPAWIPIIVIFREFAVSGYRLIAVQNSGKVIAANVWGKLKTVTQMIAIILMFLTTQPYFAFVLRAKTEQDALVNSALTYMTTGDFVMNILASIFMTISVIATIFSGYEYLKGGKDLLKDC